MGLTYKEYQAIPEGQKPYPDHTQVNVKRGENMDDRYRAAVKAAFKIGAGGYDFAKNTLSGAVVFSSERDLDKLTEKARESVEWLRDGDPSCRVVISQGDYGWLRQVRVVECYPSVDNTIKVSDIEQHPSLGPIRLT